jgi:hypothetical protein
MALLPLSSALLPYDTTLCPITWNTGGLYDTVTPRTALLPYKVPYTFSALLPGILEACMALLPLCSAWARAKAVNLLELSCRPIPDLSHQIFLLFH